ncbi:MAG TPA: hypothetical protein VFB72_16525 [Verrucomicrobiae bacterium]|nr:hypothetical protein [Verrucomicrobiae bacterium]
MLRCRAAMIAVLFAFAARPFICTAQPVLSTPVLTGNGAWAQITVSNCYNTYAQYVLLMSTNLTDWSTITNYSSTGSNFSVAVPTTNAVCYYRLKVALPFLPTLAIFCKSNLDIAGNNCTYDSFDSSSVATGQWSTAVRQANANIAAYNGILNSLNIGNADIYGTAYTGPGTLAHLVEIGPRGSVGGTNWIGSGTYGIEAGHWKTNLSTVAPDVVAPNTNGWFTSFPPATNGSIVLNGGNYVVTNLPDPLIVSNATATVWVNSSNAVSLGVTITNGGHLILYVGQSTGTGTALGWSGQGTCNFPGYAANLQIYGLPSLTSIDFSGNVDWIATVYAPEAVLKVGGGGTFVQDTSGQITANSLILRGHWNFHYDQSLANLNLHP